MHISYSKFLQKVLLFLLLILTENTGFPDNTTSCLDFPVKKVTFFKHGVGYFERLGRVNGTAAVSLKFKADQMRDLLKSIFAIDLGGGTVSSVKFNAQDATSKRLNAIPMKVDENQALSNFLKKLKGSRVSVKIGGEQIAGQILGIEPLDEMVDEKSLKMGSRLVLFTNEGRIKTSYDRFECL